MADDAQGAAGAADHAAEGGLVFHPMDQFLVKPLFGEGAVAWYTPTNVTLWMALTVLAIFALLVLGSARRAIVPSRGQKFGFALVSFVSVLFGFF